MMKRKDGSCSCDESRRALCCFTSEPCFNLVLGSHFIKARRAIISCLQTRAVLLNENKAIYIAAQTGFRHTQMRDAVSL